MDEIRFLQASDLHLGGRAWPGCFDLDGEKAALRARELREAVARLGELARTEDVEVVLIPGDLFDRETVEPDLVNLVVDTFAALAPVPVYIAPGNHDHYSATSPYHPRARLHRHQPPWPENVHIFSEPEFASVPLPGRPEVSVTGAAFLTNQPIARRRLAERIARPASGISILLLHGARVEFVLEETQKVTFPFTAGELLAQGFSYTALGHYHLRSEINDGAGRLRATYGGRPFAAELQRDPTAPAPGCLIGSIGPDGASEVVCRPLDARQALEIDVVCERIGSPEAMWRQARAAMRAAGATADDLLRFSFTGTRAPGFDPDPAPPADLCFAIAASTRRLRPAFDLNALLAAAESEAAPVESLFVRQLHARIVDAESDAERLPLQDALEYGLCALKGLPLEVRDAD